MSILERRKEAWKNKKFSSADDCLSETHLFGMPDIDSPTNSEDSKSFNTRRKLQLLPGSRGPLKISCAKPLKKKYPTELVRHMKLIAGSPKTSVPDVGSLSYIFMSESRAVNKQEKDINAFLNGMGIFKINLGVALKEL